MSRHSYEQLVALVEGDLELIEHLVEVGEIRREDDHVVVDVERVQIAHTLVHELEIDWPGVEVILRLRAELIAARERIAELERELAAK